MLKNNEVSRRRFLTAALSTAVLATIPGRAMADNSKTNAKGDQMAAALTPYLLFDGTLQAGNGVLRILFWRGTHPDES